MNGESCPAHFLTNPGRSADCGIAADRTRHLPTVMPDPLLSVRAGSTNRAVTTPRCERPLSEWQCQLESETLKSIPKQPAAWRHRVQRREGGMHRLVNVVHFPHPGGEHNPGNRPVMPWNAGRHHRTFLLTSGVWRDTTDGPDRSGEVTIWGEWEPPSDVVHRWAKQPHLPTLLQEPCRTPLPAGKNLQNTDPCSSAIGSDTRIASNLTSSTGNRVACRT